MSGLPQEEITQLQNHLQQAVVACNDRCLYNSAKWYVARVLIKT